MDYALGCLLGVAVGDAAGATLERAGADAPVSEAAASAAMAMPGSVSPLLGQGQTTDDTELTICLAKGEVSGTVGRQLPMHQCSSTVRALQTAPTSSLFREDCAPW